MWPYGVPRSGRLADKLRHIRRQLVAFHLGKCSEENTIDLFKGMHHFQLGQKRNHLRNAAAHGFEEQDFSAEIRLKIRSGELQKTADMPQLVRKAAGPDLPIARTPYIGHGTDAHAAVIGKFYQISSD